MVVVSTYCDSHVARQEKVRSADLRKGFPEVSLPRPQLSYNRPGPAELGPAWLGSATPLLAQEKLGPTGASPPLFSSLTFWSGKFLSISFSPHFLTSQTQMIPTQHSLIRVSPAWKQTRGWLGCGAPWAGGKLGRGVWAEHPSDQAAQ